MTAEEKKIKKLAAKSTAMLTDAEWEARGDAWALQTAELIASDPERLAEAKLWAAVLAQTEKTGAEAFSKVANG